MNPLRLTRGDTDLLITRHDVSQVPLQGGYISKWCPVRIQNDVLLPAEPVPVSPEVQLRFDQGVAFEASIFAALQQDAGADWLFVSPDLDREAAIAVTVEAMSHDLALIAGGWLPIDETGRRTGRPDLLVFFDGGYVPIDVKHHLTLAVAEDRDGLQVSELARPNPDEARPRPGWEARKHKGDLLQLAHYRRMLEASGFASRSSRGGIIGKEGVVVWHDLDQPIWQTPAKTKKRKLRSTMEIYDFEFGFRLDIAAVARQHLSRPEAELLVEPVWSGECPDCPWIEACKPILTAGSGDPSLLPLVGYREWRLLRDHGIKDRAAVAKLSHRTASLVAAGVDLELEADLDPTTLALGPAPFLPSAILNARAATGNSPVYRLPGRSGLDVFRADLELDIDMESTNDGVYLWGVLVTDRANTGLVEPGYRPFVTWQPIDATAEREVFRSLWDWLKELRALATKSRVSLTAYCWYSSAENTQMRRIAAEDPVLAQEVAEFIGSEHWVDLERVFKEMWITGGSRSLKSIAPLAGHSWAVDDPGGGLSMVRHVEATNHELDRDARDEAREWLLAYNRGDVEATLRIREWLDSEGPTWPEVAGW